ncbi:MAG: dTDP-glucose 4,6-dehydratase [Spirochaetales bacterium]|nr:dTDP-glucose 4,6-dehydratase [Spirochaetales bacterium]
MRKLTNIMVTGGCGFIGSNFIRHLFLETDFAGTIVNTDILTYAGNPENLTDIQERFGGTRYYFERASVCDYRLMTDIFSRYKIDTVVHFAAESHVDRSIFGPKDFIQTNIVGTFTLLEAARKYWKERGDVIFYNISTDEVFGSLGKKGFFTEGTAYNPRSPYSASKASADHLVRAAHHTYGLPVIISHCSNNFGPYQFPEKLIPLIILNILDNRELPVYGDGKHIRDWLFVTDHARAILLILQRGETGETYAVGGDNEWRNIDLVHLLCERAALLQGKNKHTYKKNISFVRDRPGHDRRYAIDCSKLKKTIGWKPSGSFIEKLDTTITWYMEHIEWVDHIKSGDYATWIEKQYGTSTS